MNAANILVVDDEPQIRRVMRSTLTAKATSLPTPRPAKKPWKSRADRSPT